MKSALPFRPPASRANLSGFVAAAVLIGMTAPAAHGAWEVQPRVEVGNRFETNPRLTRDKNLEDEANGQIVDAQIRGSYRTERTIVSLTPRYRWGYYSENDQEDLEDRDIFLTFAAQHQTRLQAFGLGASYSDVGIRRNEIAGTDDRGDINFVSEDRERFTVSPNWEYQLSPRFVLALSGTYEDVEYDRDSTTPSFGRFDYDYYQGEVLINRILDEKTRIGIAGTASQFESMGPVDFFPFGVQEATSESDSSGVSLVLERALSSTLRATLRAGYTKTDVKTNSFQVQFVPVFPFQALVPVTFESDTTNFTGLVSLEKSGERTTYTLTVSRAISPNSRGGEVVSDRINARMGHQLSRRANLTLGVTGFQQEDVSEGPIAQTLRREQRYAQAFVDFGWRMTRDFLISGAYRFTWVEDESNFVAARDATNHNVFIRLIYRPDPWRN